MTGFLFPPETVSLPILGEAVRFPVRRVFCVGRNYAEHAREMGHDAREPPFFFGKSAEAVTDAATIAYPPATAELHHEVELVAALGREVAHAAAPEAVRNCIYGYAVGIDLTRRDLQAEAKRLARPWFLAKSFIHAAPMSPIAPAAAVGHPRRGRIRLAVNGEARQEGELAEMIWSVDEVIAALSRYDRLLPGDLVFTGTPAGVGPVRPGDRLTAKVEGLAPLEVRIEEAA